MSNIIKKLGIKPIEVRSQHNHNDFKWFYELEIKEVRELEQQSNEMLKALIEYHKREEVYLRVLDKSFEIWNKITPIIEKACYPKKWPEIKELS